jgi:zinc protease
VQELSSHDEAGGLRQVLNILEHMYDNPGAAPRRLLGRLLYGRDSVFARTPTPDQIVGLTRADVAAHLRTWQRPDAAVLGIAGKIC